ncbi:hypothetical protein Taro_012803, partial [Colocasia esculenta]|nr:hypothetical protein [Colocasia esculenta]
GFFLPLLGFSAAAIPLLLIHDSGGLEAKMAAAAGFFLPLLGFSAAAIPLLLIHDSGGHLLEAKMAAAAMATNTLPLSADNLRQETLHQLCRILTIWQSAKCFLAIGEMLSSFPLGLPATRSGGKGITNLKSQMEMGMFTLLKGVRRNDETFVVQWLI